MNEIYHDRKSKSVKYLASYCWKWDEKNKAKKDINIPEKDPVFSKNWNPNDEQDKWFRNTYPGAVDQVGSIFTSQGLEYDYVAFIWWDDLVWRTDHWKCDLERIKTYYPLFKKSIKNCTEKESEDLLINMYWVILTRAKKGIHIWFKDEETKNHFRDVVLKRG